MTCFPEGPIDNNHQNSKNKISAKKWNLCREVYSEPPMYQIWRIYLHLWGHDCKKCVWSTFACKVGQSDSIVMKLKLDMSRHLLNVYTKFQIDISKHVEKSPENSERRMDGHCHSIIRCFSNECIKTLHWFRWWLEAEEVTTHYAHIFQHLYMTHFF